LSSVGIGNSYLSSLYVQIHPGDEESVVNQLSASGHTNLYKVIGQYDLLSLFDTNDLDNALLYTKNDGIVSSTAMSAYSYIIDDEYTSPNAAQWLAEAPILGFIYLELDKWLYSPESGSSSGINACQIIIKKLKEISDKLNISIAIYGGFGRSELYVLVKTNKLEDVWEFTHECRGITLSDCLEEFNDGDKHLPVFANTVTIPCFSYKNIKQEDGKYIVNGIEGNCRAAISIKCQSGFESYINSYFKDTDTYNIKGTFGIDDVILYTIKDVLTSKFLEDLLSFRKKWRLDKRGPIDTSTTIIDTSNKELNLKVKGYDIIQAPLQISYSAALEENNPRLANRLKTFFNNINSCRANRVYLVAISKLSMFTEYLSQLIEEYQAKHNAYNYAQRFYAESRLLEAIETAELGLSQRVESKINPNNSCLSLPLYFGDGVFSNLIALEYLIDYIFIAWSDSVERYTGKAESSGFPAYSDSFGFKVRFGETIFLPLVSTYNPLSKEGNWLTLTHEISHALYTRYGIGDELEDYYQKVIATNFKERIVERELQVDSVFFDQVYELFAHWYDYYHFYNCDYERYTLNVWNSWMLLPIVHENFIEYYFRSYVIYVMHNMEEVRATGGRGQGYRDVMHRLWGEHEAAIKALPLDIPEDKCLYINEKKKSLMKLFQKYAPVMNKFYDLYRNDDFRNKINQAYDEIDVHVDEVMRGSIVLGNVKNPYLLLKNTQYKSSHGNELRASTALVLSLKNQKSFLSEHVDK